MGDCDDIAAEVHPEAVEVCDGVDNDCDGQVDPEGTPGSGTWYPDADSDGYGDPDGAVGACEAPSGHVAESGDCDDADAAVHPAAEELCGPVDQDCDGVVSQCPLADSGAMSTLGFPFLEGDEAGGSLGRSVSSADLDGDGVHDLLAGGYLYGGDVGTAFIAHGPLSGTVPVAGLATVTGAGAYDYMGSAVAGIPDLDGDGFDELAVGAMGVSDGGGTPGRGVVLVFYGPITTGAGSLRREQADLELTWSAGRSNVGSTLWAGDVSGDGVAELLVGADTADSAMTSGFWAVDGTALASGELDTLGAFYSEEDPLERTGEEVKVIQDTDGDGIDDVLVTSLLSDAGYLDGGTVSLFLGPVAPDWGTVGDADDYLDGETTYGYLGQSLAGGDLDGDGYGEVVLGAYDDDRFSDYGGAAYVFSGPFAGAAGLGGASVVVAGGEVSGRLGNGVAIQDLEADGQPELVVTYAAMDGYAGGVVVFDGPVSAGTYSDADATRAWSGDDPGDGFQLELEAVGDLTGDGVGDLALGLPSWSGGDQRGAVAVLPSVPPVGPGE